MRPEFSRLVVAAGHEWHVLDNGPVLAERGIEPVGTILCVHGNPTWSYLWRSLVAAATDAASAPDAAPDVVSDAAAHAESAQPAASAAWRVVAVDQLDMGFSERTGEHRALAQRVRDLGDLTDELGLSGPVVTLGHDWGGVVSLGWAVDHPDETRGIMLLNTAVHQPEGDPIPAPLRLALAGPILGASTVATPAFLETTLALAHPALGAEVKAGYRAPYAAAARRGGIGGFVADIPADDRHESRPELDRIAVGIRALDVPSLLLWGPRDPIFSDRYLDDLSRRLRRADVHRVEGAGHLIAEDVDIATLALSWLDDRAPHLDASETPAERPGVPRATAVTGAASSEGPTAPHYQPLWHYLEAFAESGDTALVEMAPPRSRPQRTVSWRLLSRRVREIAAGLVASGVRPGDRVSLLVPPGADLTAVLYACVRIGAIVVVADAGLGLAGLTRAVRGARCQHVIGATKGLAAARALGWPGRRISVSTLDPATARMLGVTHSLADLVALGRETPLPAVPASEAVAAILFTSGSTGPAKGVVYTHAQLSGIRSALAAQYGVGPGTGLVAGFAPFALLGPALGARSATPDMDVTAPRTLTAKAVAAATAAVDGTVVFLSPAAIANVVATAPALDDADRAALGGVETFLSAGAPVSESLLSAAAALMPAATPHTPYGMTEGLLLADITLDGIRDAARSRGRGAGGVCVGRPTATTTVRIAPLANDGSAADEPLDIVDVTGEIVVSAPHIEDHYDRLFFTDRAARRGTVPGERWHRTGDVGHVDSEGRLWVEGRLPHVIVTATGVVTPVEPELRTESVDGVARAAIVGVGPRGTQHLVAIVETVPPARAVGMAHPALASRVRDAVGSALAAVIVVPALPTDIRHNSKIDRARLSTWATSVLSGERMTRP
ncbi:alpha/beta fold hydrolase [Marisediminicola sp. LYQ85]|uniref:alpha/beta fold hydrolase n=1 Tax=Marisediminicola sp. LYQ85 TaxID=3391062 RepID=UPI003982DB09